MSHATTLVKNEPRTGAEAATSVERGLESAGACARTRLVPVFGTELDVDREKIQLVFTLRKLAETPPTAREEDSELVFWVVKTRLHAGGLGISVLTVHREVAYEGRQANVDPHAPSKSIKETFALAREVR